jgi:hypothetical protein
MDGATPPLRSRARRVNPGCENLAEAYLSMRPKLHLSFLSLAALVSLPLAAQQTIQSPSSGSEPQYAIAGPMPAALLYSPAAPARTGNQPAVPVPCTANAPEVNNSALRPVQGELQSRLDSTTAKPGDRVVLKTTGDATTADGVVIPRGARIIGKVVDSQPAGSGTQRARITVQFDRVQLAGGRTVRIKTVLQAVGPSNAATDPSTLGGLASTDASEKSHSASSAVSAPAANTPPASGTIVAQQGDVAIKTTALPGVLIAANANGQPFSNASGALLSAQQNVRLNGGTQVVLAVVHAAKKSGRTR